jgi:hypothetical protein
MKGIVNIANRSCYLPLRDAVLCADCEFISSDRGDVCAVCGGMNLLKVSEVLGQPAMPETAQKDLGFVMLDLGCESMTQNASAVWGRREKRV